MPKTFHVYILASRSRNLYTGMTSDLVGRVYEHKTKAFGGHKAKYNIDRLVHVEEYPKAAQAFARERDIKDWTRQKRVDLIESTNPAWDDLSAGWYDLSEGIVSLRRNADP